MFCCMQRLKLVFEFIHIIITSVGAMEGGKGLKLTGIGIRGGSRGRQISRATTEVKIAYLKKLLQLSIVTSRSSY
jgi:hypothetical protein